MINKYAFIYNQRKENNADLILLLILYSYLYCLSSVVSVVRIAIEHYGLIFMVDECIDDLKEASIR